MPRRRACRRCGEPVQDLTELRRAAGASGPVEVQTEMHVQRCASGHLRWPDADYGQLFIVPLLTELERAVQRDAVGPRRTFGRRRCGRCGGRLAKTPERRYEARVEFSVDALPLPPLSAAIRVPTYECATCGTAHHWWDRRLEAEATEAVTRAVEALDLVT